MERELIGLPAADENALKIIATARKLTRDYNFTDYEDKEQRNAILMKLFGKIGKGDIRCPILRRYYEKKNILL